MWSQIRCWCPRTPRGWHGWVDMVIHRVLGTASVRVTVSQHGIDVKQDVFRVSASLLNLLKLWGLHYFGSLSAAYPAISTSAMHGVALKEHLPVLAVLFAIYNTTDTCSPTTTTDLERSTEALTRQTETIGQEEALQLSSDHDIDSVFGDAIVSLTIRQRGRHRAASATTTVHTTTSYEPHISPTRGGTASRTTHKDCCWLCASFSPPLQLFFGTLGIPYTAHP